MHKLSTFREMGIFMEHSFAEWQLSGHFLLAFFFPSDWEHQQEIMIMIKNDDYDIEMRIKFLGMCKRDLKNLSDKFKRVLLKTLH